MITHEEARFEVGLCISAYDMNERLNAEQQLYKYITQQEKKDIISQKEHKLLKLYREQSQAIFDEDFTKAIIIQNDIDILEEKLEALK